MPWKVCTGNLLGDEAGSCGCNTAMNIKTVKIDATEIAIVNSEEICISDVQTALDFMMSVYYETRSHSIVINKEAVIEDFFVLSTRIAGEILRKFITYQFKLAIFGDFSCYTS